MTSRRRTREGDRFAYAAIIWLILACVLYAGKNVSDVFLFLAWTAALVCAVCITIAFRKRA